ncbi:MAG TPA: TauD/TfdA family dioxygenase [Xanthobacteraceae bacterium]|nr:TauD/TfdA family dioxygenase [Xanthobacteraceae bacterium]
MNIENGAPHIGALVTGLDVKRMSADEWQTLYRAWLDRHVLIVRGQDLSKQDFLDYSRRFGRLKPHMITRTRDPAHAEITLMGVTSMAKDADGEKLILDRGQAWHTDSPWDTEICKGTQLYGIEIPSYGGDTLFASMHAAYDALPDRLKDRIAPLKVMFRYGGRDRKWFDLLDPADQARPPAVHDMVRVHAETGRKSLYVNPTHAIGIVGMPDGEADRLLAELYWYMLQPNAEYRHKWQVGDIVIWDNRCTVHAAAGGYPSSERRVHWRTTIMQ